MTDDRPALTTRTLRLVGGELDGTTTTVEASGAPPRVIRVPIPAQPGMLAEYEVAIGGDGPKLIWKRTLRDEQGV